MGDVEATLYQYAKNRGYLKKGAGEKKGWLSELVDQKLMTTGAESEQAATSGPSTSLTHAPVGAHNVQLLQDVFELLANFLMGADTGQELKEQFGPILSQILGELQNEVKCLELDSGISEKLGQQFHRLFPDHSTEDRKSFQEETTKPILISKSSASQLFVWLNGLEKCRGSLLLQLLKKIIRIAPVKVKANSRFVAETEEGVKESPDVDDGDPLFLPDESATVVVDSLKKCLEYTSAAVTALPSIRFYSLNSPLEHVICCDTSSDGGNYLAAGLENSALMLSRINIEAPPLASSTACTNMTLSIGGPVHSSLPSLTNNPNYRLMYGHSASVYDVRFISEPSGQSCRYLLSCSADGTTRLFDVTGSRGNVCAYRGHLGPVWKLDIFQQQFFATVSLDQTARLYDFERTFPVRVLAAHEDSVDCLAFSPANSNLLATGSGDGTARLWSFSSAQPVRLFSGLQGGVECLSFSPDGRYLLCSTESRRLHVFELSSGKLLHAVDKESWHDRTVHCMSALGNSGHLLASAGADGCVKITEWEKGGRQETFPTPSRATTMSMRYISDINELYCAGCSL